MGSLLHVELGAGHSASAKKGSAKVSTVLPAEPIQRSGPDSERWAVIQLSEGIHAIIAFDRRSPFRVDPMHRLNQLTMAEHDHLLTRRGGLKCSSQARSEQSKARMTLRWVHEYSWYRNGANTSQPIACSPRLRCLRIAQATGM